MEQNKQLNPNSSNNLTNERIKPTETTDLRFVALRTSGSHALTESGPGPGLWRPMRVTDRVCSAPQLVCIGPPVHLYSSLAYLFTLMID